MEFVQPIRDKKKIEAMKRVLRSNLRDHCLFILGINSGLRISDLLDLKISDVIDPRGKVKDRIELREEKTGKAKNFPIGDNAKKAIREYLLTRNYSMDQPLFISRKGENQPINRVQAYKILNAAAEMVGIEEKIGTHSMRKTFGYHAYQDGRSIELIQKILNHTSPSVTLRYIGITQDEMDDVYLSINL